MNPSEEGSTASTYEIVVDGELGENGPKWLDGSAHRAELREGASPATVLTVHVRDQAALRGIVNQLWDLNLTLIGIRRIQAHAKKEGSHDG
jgi:hypothetical protein